MMLNTNYSALARDGQIDLVPIFEALRSGAAEDVLLPVFAKFEQKASEFGLVAQLPPPLAALDPAERARLLERYEAQRGLTGTANLEPPDGPEDEAAEFKRRVTNTFVQGFRNSPLGQRMDAGQLSYFLSEQLDDLLTANQLRVEPIVDALRQQGILDPEIYVAVARAQERLKTIDIDLIEPTLDIRPEMKGQLLRRAKSLEAPPRARSSMDRGKTEEQSRKSLEEFDIPTQKTPPGTGRWVRVGVLAVVLVGLAAGGYLTRPNREVPVGAFEQSIPLESARMVDGAFSGTIDWDRWNQLPVDEQRERLQRFETTIREKGWYADFQLRGRGDEVLVVPFENAVRASPKLYSDFVVRPPPAAPRPTAPSSASPSDEGDTEAPASSPE